MRKEDRLQKMIAQYMSMQYPRAIFNSDMSGLKLTMGQAVKAKQIRSDHAFPDFVVYEVRGRYSALFIELKNELSDVYLVNGVTLKASKHIHKQAATLQALRDKGYFAEFGFGFDHCKEIIDQYMAHWKPDRI